MLLVNSLTSTAMSVAAKTTPKVPWNGISEKIRSPRMRARPDSNIIAPSESPPPKSSSVDQSTR